MRIKLLCYWELLNESGLHVWLRAKTVLSPPPSWGNLFAPFLKMIFASDILRYSMLHSECVCGRRQMLLHAVTRPELWPWEQRRGGCEEWPEITKTIPPRQSDNKEPFWRLFSFHPSLYHCHLISPADTLIGCLCQRLLILGSFLLFLLLIYKIRLKNNFKMTPRKKLDPKIIPSVLCFLLYSSHVLASVTLTTGFL